MELEIKGRILVIRNQRVMLSAHLAELYEVEPRVLIQAIKRNPDRFPSDFMFQLTEKEMESLRSQFVILKKGRGGHSKYPLHAFTEHGVAMLSGVLNSRRAIQVNIAIIRAFIKMRQIVLEYKDLTRRLDELERKYDTRFRVVFDAIRKLMEPQEGSKRRIGFHASAEGNLTSQIARSRRSKI